MRNNTRLRELVAVVILSLAAQLPSAVQTISGPISGTVLDSTGAVVPQATVTAKNTDQNTSVSTTTSDAGIFVFPQLAPAKYTLIVERAGFKTSEQRDVTLNANTNLSLGNITLQVGAVAPTVGVVAQGAQLQRETAERGSSIVGTQGCNSMAYLNEKLREIKKNSLAPIRVISLTISRRGVESTLFHLLLSFKEEET